MPASPEQFHARVRAVADAEGRLPLSRMTGWEIFPFEPDGLQVVPLASPVLPEPPRAGEDPASCRACATPIPAVWSDERWRLSTLAEPGGAPLVLVLEPVEHHDLDTIPDELAAELGVLVAHTVRAVERLPHIARAHVSRWGDGGAHLHVFFFARPQGFGQLRGTCFAIWDNLLPAVPVEERDRDAAAVAAALVDSYGGRAG